MQKARFEEKGVPIVSVFQDNNVQRWWASLEKEAISSLCSREDILSQSLLVKHQKV